VFGTNMLRESIRGMSRHRINRRAFRVRDERNWCDAVFVKGKAGEVEIRFVSELCHIPPETLGQHRHLRGHAEADRCCGKSLIGSALVGFGVRQHARRESISKRAPSTTRTSLRLESITYERSGSHYRTRQERRNIRVDHVSNQQFASDRWRIAGRIVSDP